MKYFAVWVLEDLTKVYMFYRRITMLYVLMTKYGYLTREHFKYKYLMKRFKENIGSMYEWKTIYNDSTHQS